ncbi:MAG TPA: response regulator, partial [Chthoniobacterales bacterium]
AISKQLAALMEGQMGVRSRPGEGSTFWFTVRLEKQTGPARPDERHHPGLVGVRVLIVDDNAVSRQNLQRQTQAWKMQSAGAADASETLQRLRAAAAGGQPYHVALLDQQVPEPDGQGLIKAIQADPALAGLRLIVLTSPGHGGGSPEPPDARIAACLAKPVKPSRLFDCLATVMDHAPLGPFIPSNTRQSAPPVLEPGPNPQQMRILLAEDNVINQKVALGQLRRLRFRADAVANGLEVLKALQQVPYDVILMDCQMPEMDGYGAARAIRQREQQRDPPCPWTAPIHIIAMTANAMQGDREGCLQAGMNDYLSKPVRTAELRAALERCPVNARH